MLSRTSEGARGTLLTLVRTFPKPLAWPMLSDREALELIQVAARHGLAPILAESVERGGSTAVPAETRDALRRAAMIAVAQSMRVRRCLFRALEALARQDGNALLREVDLLDEHAPDYGAVLDDLLASLQHLAVLQLV